MTVDKGGSGFTASFHVWEEKMTQWAGKLDGNIYLTALKNAFIQAMPLLIVGSFFVLFAYLPFPGYEGFMKATFGENWQSFFLIANTMTMGAMTLYVVVGIANSLATSHDLDRISAIFCALAAFLLVTPIPALAAKGAGQGLPMNYLSANGLFVGMIVSIAAVEILRFVQARGWVIKMPPSVPPNVSRSFSVLIPVLIITVLFAGIRILMTMTPYGDLQTLIFTFFQQPMTALGATLPATLVVMLFESVLWAFGIHGANIVGSIMQPVWLSLTAQNADAFAAGAQLPNIVTLQFYANFAKVGGSGSTLGLCLMLLFMARSQQFKSLGKLAIGPQIFTINEPLTFGIPIVLNPLMVIPFILVPQVMTLMAYGSMAMGLVPYPNGINIPWTTPPIIAGFLVSGWQGAILNAVQVVVSALIYYPFFRAVDDKAVADEQAFAEAFPEDKAAHAEELAAAAPGVDAAPTVE